MARFRDEGWEVGNDGRDEERRGEGEEGKVGGSEKNENAPIHDPVRPCYDYISPRTAPSVHVPRPVPPLRRGRETFTAASTSRPRSVSSVLVLTRGDRLPEMCRSPSVLPVLSRCARQLTTARLMRGEIEAGKGCTGWGQVDGGAEALSHTFQLVAGLQ